MAGSDGWGFSPERAGGGDLSQLDSHVLSAPWQDLASRGTLCLPCSGACTLLRTWCRQPRIWLPRLRTAVSATIDSSVRFLLSWPRRVCWPKRMCCVGFWISCPGGSASALGPASTCLAGWPRCVHRVFPAVLAGMASRSLSEA